MPWPSLLMPAGTQDRPLHSLPRSRPLRHLLQKQTPVFTVTFSPKRHHRLTHHVLDLGECDLQCNVQHSVRVFYWTQSIGVVFKKIAKQLLSIFSVCGLYGCSKTSTWISVSNKTISGVKSSTPALECADEFFLGGWSYLA